MTAPSLESSATTVYANAFSSPAVSSLSTSVVAAATSSAVLSDAKPLQPSSPKPSAHPQNFVPVVGRRSGNKGNVNASNNQTTSAASSSSQYGKATQQALEYHLSMRARYFQMAAQAYRHGAAGGGHTNARLAKELSMAGHQHTLAINTIHGSNLQEILLAK